MKPLTLQMPRGRGQHTLKNNIRKLLDIRTVITVHI